MLAFGQILDAFFHLFLNHWYDDTAEAVALVSRGLQIVVPSCQVKAIGLFVRPGTAPEKSLPAFIKILLAPLENVSAHVIETEAIWREAPDG